MADFPKLARIKQDDENMEKLHCAARRGQTELIRRLIDTGISPTIANKFAASRGLKYGQSFKFGGAATCHSSAAALPSGAATLREGIEQSRRRRQQDAVRRREEVSAAEQLRDLSQIADEDALAQWRHLRPRAAREGLQTARIVLKQ